MSVPVRVLVAEDQALLRASLAALLGAEPDLEVVAQVADGAEAVRLATRLRPDVVLTDIRMPVADGIEATRLIRAALSDTRVIVLTMFEDDEYILGALRAGAAGFLLKDAEPQAVVDAVRTVHAGQALLSPQALARLLGPVPPARGGGIEGLTPRQREVLTLIARGMSNTEIEEELGITRATRRSHVTALLSRLGARDRAQLVIAAYEAGLVRPAQQGS
ncbi:DNA-binding response regulator, NarL/FixJ family, contains REC and HTH domains [Actinomyces ruminicola]|uniref:DNA-binding response regulator, NarL/FixJ family, contains REC and HTH domains n=1 Tax=Actinomyces ruminicola TaxID=332524 RepID=A0A1H0CLE8_9ACTO|nr:response regulator transcription factor [Actinomyces ruminicola]SDN58694.1 DNA-binding response regulator, NarL/FixJ family, contains REC and HTH domains [Actinomyces ruminicola]